MMDNFKTNGENIMVSVLMITYNHEDFIEEAIKGILIQQIDFPVELLICNDASTDNTNKIIESCINHRNSQITISYYHHKQNVGMMANFIFGLERCAGKYIALCEGDDYWSDPNKLQKQVDFLEANEDFSLSFHNVTCILPNTDSVMDTADKKKLSYTLEDITKTNFIHTCSVIFRSTYLPLFLRYHTEFSIGDYPLFILLATEGKLGLMHDKMACYRLHDNGVWHSFGEIKRVKALKRVTCFFSKYFTENACAENVLNNVDKMHSDSIEALVQLSFSENKPEEIELLYREYAKTPMNKVITDAIFKVHEGNLNRYEKLLVSKKMVLGNLIDKSLRKLKKLLPWTR